jgi:hypothetical protein
VKYLKAEGVPKAAIDAVETLSNEVHASWQSAMERIEELIEGEK